MAPRARSTRDRARLAVGLGAGAVLASALTYVGLVDPHRSGSLFPACPFKLLTGWNCPGCGGLRMVHDLLHGDIAAAAIDNVFLLAGLPTLALWVFWRHRQGRTVANTPALVIIAVLVVGWTVVRNLPGFPLVPTILGG